MKKYIDADKVISNAIKERRFVFQKEDLANEEVVVRTIYSDLAEFLYAQPNADVMEIRHGYWKDKYGNKYDNHFYECSVCGGEALCKAEVDELSTVRWVQVLSPGCPHCLAKMDEKGGI